MADDPQRLDSEPATTKPAKEDAETTATRRELKQTTISDSADKPAQPSQDSSEPSEDEAEPTKTPESKTKDAPHDDLREQVSSPKKKRAHDQLEEQMDDADEDSAASSSADKRNGSATLSRTDRSEPQKKRARDENSDDELSRPGSSSGLAATGKPSNTKDTAPSATSHKTEDKPKETSASAFASSGFAKLASSAASPFGTIGAASKSGFGGGSSQSGFGGFGGGAAPSPFSAAAGPPKLSFGVGSGTAASTGATSPFGGLNGGQPSGFGSVLGGGGSFGSLLSGAKLSSFGKPGEVFKSDKPAKPFGAPDSDAEDEGDDDEDGEDGSGDEEGVQNEDSKQKENDKDEEPKVPSDDKKKPKLQKVVVDDGEAGEVTLLQVRAKMFLMEKGVGWKERGAGMLKVNVPQSSVEFDEQGIPRPETFDASVLDDDPMPDGSKGRKSVRLIMRQDHTLRVILNTVILPAMDFQLNQKLKASLILFMAFDGPNVQQVQMKMSEVNANNFTNLMRTIQHELRDA